MRINYNISAMIANSSLKSNDNVVAQSIERLSSGLKINHAKDNASGLAMAKRMNAQLKSLEVANQNSEDGISVIEIAEGALMEVEDMVQRMNELSVKACNGTISDDERGMIDDEINQLKSEVERIASTTMYNGKILLDGSFDVKGYTSNVNLKVTTYSDDVRSGNYNIDNIHLEFNADGTLKEDDCSIAISNTADKSFIAADVKSTFIDDRIILNGANGFELEFQIKNWDTTQDFNETNIKVDITGLGSMGLQIGTNEGQELDVRIATISLRSLGLEKVDCKTADNAAKFLEQMNSTLQYVNEARSRLGAYQNRLEHTVSTLDISEENMTSAYSRIMDVDMSEEMTEYTTYQVLVQSSTAMLAQANDRPSQVLQLLQQ